MKVVQITRKAALKKDDDQNFWLVIEVQGSSAAFNLTAALANKVTYEPDAGFQSTLQAFMDEQETPNSRLQLTEASQTKTTLEIKLNFRRHSVINNRRNQ